MKTIVIYSSKTGATKYYAEAISRAIPNSTLASIDKEHPDLQGYDRVILGAGVRMGKAYGSMRKFMKKQLPALLEKQTAIFFCNGAPETFQATVEKSVHEQLRSSAVALSCLRGTEPFKKADEVSGWKDEEALEAFVGELKG